MLLQPVRDQLCMHQPGFPSGSPIRRSPLLLADDIIQILAALRQQIARLFIIKERQIFIHTSSVAEDGHFATTSRDCVLDRPFCSETRSNSSPRVRI